MLLYTGVLLYNAYLGNAASRGLSGYMVGNRAMGGVVVGISFFATFASTNSYIGHAGKGYAYGFAWLTMAVLLVIFSWVSWRWVGPPMRRFASAWDALTIPDFLGSRFVPPGPSAERHPLRLAAAVVIAFSSLLYLLAIFKGAGHLFQFFLNVDYELAVGITLVIVMLYTSIGGFVSVVRTDVIQGLLMLIGSVMIFYFVTRAAGGISAVGELRLNPEKDFLFDLNGGVPFAVLLGVSLSGSLKLLVDPRQISRFFALKDDAAAQQGIWVAAGGLAIILFCLFPVGIYAHLILTDVSDTDLIVPTLVSDPSRLPLLGCRFFDCRYRCRSNVIDGQCAPRCRINPLQESDRALPCDLIGSPPSQMDPLCGAGFCYDSRGHGLKPARGYRRNHHLLRQSLCSLFFSSSALWTLLGERHRQIRTVVHATRHDSATPLDPTGSQANAT